MPNVKGRISYISSKARQENLYAVYETTDRKFWTELARCNQEEFKKSGTEGSCIEATDICMRRVRSVMLRINIVEQKKREKEKYTLQWFLLDFHANKW